MDKFTGKIKEIIDIVYQEEKEKIKEAAMVIFESIKDGGILHVFATGHSHMLAEEMFYRAGGLVAIDPVLRPFLMQHEGAISSTKFERLPGIAKIVFDGLDKNVNDPFIVVSNSGINAVPVEFAEIARENNHKVIAITSVSSSKNLKPRTLNNKHLYECGDIVIDNHVPHGDGVIETKYGNVGAVSSIVCSYIAQSLVLEIINLFIENDITPPIYMSANLEGGDEHNKKIYEEYKSRVKSLY
ncbi:MAG: SIS domain-containing protein [Bacilli bacterium]|nr:SIS domain-containing protein [Bacilli bacterium]